ncbi:MAG: hypothetical protein ACTSWQ_06445 [Candidatus Thorarchaeota archaeon]
MIFIACFVDSHIKHSHSTLNMSTHHVTGINGLSDIETVRYYTEETFLPVRLADPAFPPRTLVGPRRRVAPKYIDVDALEQDPLVRGIAPGQTGVQWFSECFAPDAFDLLEAEIDHPRRRHTKRQREEIEALVGALPVCGQCSHVVAKFQAQIKNLAADHNRAIEEKCDMAHDLVDQEEEIRCLKMELEMACGH